MPASPFGLAYGLGAGMAIAPQVMQQRQAAQNQLAMQGLQQQLLQHQVSQQQAEDQAFSQPVPPQMQTTTQTQPGFESAAAANQTLGGLTGPGGENLQLAAPTQTTQTAVKPTTPYQDLAYRQSVYADRLDKLGMGQSAMAARQRASQYWQMHSDMARGMAVQNMLRGDWGSAVNTLNSAGFPAQSAGKVSTPNGEMFYIKDPSGQTTLMSREDLSAVAADPTKVADIIGKQEQYKDLYGWRVAAADRAAQSRENVANIGAVQKGLDRQNKLDIAQLNINNRSSRATSTPAQIQAVIARKKNLMQLDPSLTDAEAEDQAWKFVKSSASQKNIPLTVARETVNRIEKANYGQPPDPSSQQYADWKQAHDIVMGAMRPSAAAAPTGRTSSQTSGNKLGPSGPNGQYRFLDYSKDGKFQLLEGKGWVTAGGK